MHPDLARVLVRKGVISRGTVLAAYHTVRSLSCVCDSNVLASFVVQGARLIRDKQIVFDTIGPEQISYEIEAEKIIKVDGMAIERIALSQNLGPNGTEIASRSRRGRKRKQPLPEMA